MKKILSIVLSLLTVCCLCVDLTGKAISFTPGFEIHSAAGLMLNYSHNNDVTAEDAPYFEYEVMYAKNADTQYMPGSLVQIMAAVIVLEQCSDPAVNTFDLSTVLTVDASLYNGLSEMTEYPDDIRTADFKDGDQVTVEELLYAMLLTSSCEAATVLANQFGNGSIQSFVDSMNTRAAELGCTQTTFTNVTGLYDVAQKTTANDLMRITLHALSIDKFREIALATSKKVGTPNVERHWGDEWIWTHSNLMTQESSTYYMEDVKGIKTANLTAQGRNIITTASRDGNNYLVILLAAPFEDGEGELQYYHMDDAKALFEWAFTHFSYETILSDSTELGQVSVLNGDRVDYVLIKPAKAYRALWYDMADIASVEQVITKTDPVSAPIKENDKLGTVTLKFSGQEIATIDLVATSSVDLSKAKYYSALIAHFPKTEWLTRAILFSVLLCAIYIALCIHSHIVYLQRLKPLQPVHLHPNSAAAKKEARSSTDPKKKKK